MKQAGVCVCAVLIAACGVPRLYGAPDAAHAVPASEEGEGAMTDYDTGLELLKAGRDDAALAAFRSAITKTEAATDPAARVIRSTAANNAGNILLRRGQAAEAEALYRQAVAADPKHALAINNLGVSLLKQGQVQAAVETFEQAVRIDPQHGMALNNLASLLIQAGKLDLAAKYLATSLKLNPQNRRQTLFLTARLYDKANRPATAQEGLYQELVSTTDGSKLARLKLATEYLQAGLLGQAERILASLLQKEKEWPEARLQQARLQALQGREAEAITALRALLPLLPQETAVRTDLAALLLRTGKTDEAGALARDATQKVPGDAAGWFILGRVNEKKGAFDEAEKCYFKAISSDRGHAEAWNNLGILAARREDVKTALTCYINALFADPDSTEAQYNLGRSLVVSKTDFERGVRLLMTASTGTGEAAERARKYVADLELIASGGDPGWKTEKPRQ